MEPVLELRGITKRFPGVLANDHISIDLKKGEIHALLGENGAGKTTLMNILYGLYKPDEGEIFVKGKKLEVEIPHDAIKPVWEWFISILCWCRYSLSLKMLCWGMNTCYRADS